MQNPRLAARYAKSLLDLSIQLNRLEVVQEDFSLLQSICKSNHDFVLFLRSPIIKPGKKEKVISKLFDSRINILTSNFIKLLVRKGRDNYLPEIIQSFYDQYRVLKGITRIKITTAVPVDEEMETTIIEKVKAITPLKTIELEKVVNKNLIGGFLLEMNDMLIDASVQRDLREIKKQFISNVYIPNIR
jgi:F-type H+-transporting ATPase subunit delta